MDEITKLRYQLTAALATQKELTAPDVLAANLAYCEELQAKIDALRPELRTWDRGTGDATATVVLGPGDDVTIDGVGTYTIPACVVGAIVSGKVVETIGQATPEQMKTIREGERETSLEIVLPEAPRGEQGGERATFVAGMIREGASKAEAGAAADLYFAMQRPVVAQLYIDSRDPVFKAAPGCNVVTGIYEGRPKSKALEQAHKTGEALGLIGRKP